MRILRLLALAFAVFLTAPAAAQGRATPSTPGLRSAASSGLEEEPILVVGRRIGVPMWHVSTPAGTLMLVGNIGYIVKGTRWNTAALDEALRRSDRVLFPEARSVAFSPLGAIGAVRGMRRIATLPDGRGLSNILAPEQFSRLQRLRQAGLLRDDFDQTHPYNLASSIRRRLERGVAYAPSLTGQVRGTVRRHGLRLVPVERVPLRTVTREIVETPPHEFVPCLMNTVALAEAGPAAIARRSQDWVERRVPEVVNSPSERMFDSCRLRLGTEEEEGEDGALWATVQHLLEGGGVTVAVINLSSLASTGGILDRLKANGNNVVGPAWRR